jgi:hypothetical protein
MHAALRFGNSSSNRAQKNAVAGSIAMAQDVSSRDDVFGLVIKINVLIPSNETLFGESGLRQARYLSLAVAPVAGRTGSLVTTTRRRTTDLRRIGDIGWASIKAHRQ